MPLSKDQMREYQRKRRAVNQGVNLANCKPDAVNLVNPMQIHGSNQGGKSSPVNPVNQGGKSCKPVSDVNHSQIHGFTDELPEGWDHVRDYIKTPGNLAKMRAVCGALGRQAGNVRFGAYGPTAQEIGTVIGTGAPVVTPSSPPVHYMPPMISVHALLERAAHGGRPT